MLQHKFNYVAYFQKGFTLIELLASTFVIVIIGSIIVSIIVSSLRGTNKANTMTTTRQNGTYAIAQISKMLRFAKSVDEINGESVTNCVGISPLPTPQPIYYSIKFTSLDGGTTVLSCDPVNRTIASNGASLLDYDFVQIATNTCQITCYQETNSDTLIVGIKFSLNTLAPSGAILPEFIASSSATEFNTSVILRNVKR